MTDERVQSNSIENINLPEDREELHNLAAQVTGDVFVREGGFIIPAAFLMFGIIFPVMAWQELQVGRFLSLLIFLLIGVFMIFLFIRTVLRRGTPFFVLTPQGLACSVFKTPLPWQAIRDFQIDASKTNAYNVAVGMEFDVDEHLLPEQNKQCRLGSWYDGERKKLVISGTNFRSDMNRDKLTALLKAYRLAAMAGRKLQPKEQG